ncbi:hypothetical protein IFR05_001910 [Cadophora sp. M221]|nr:hypothetical protein IFR05_001910 [Cadophora sp. M221]
MSRLLFCYRLFDQKHGLRTVKKSPPDDVSRQAPPVLEGQQEHCSVLEPSAPSPQSLCPRCSSLDLPALFRKKIHIRSTSGDVVVKLGKSALKLRSSPCPMCRLFGLVASSDNSKHQMHELRVIPADLLFTRLELGHLFDTNVLSVQSSLYMLARYHNLGLVDTREPTQALGSNFGVRLLDRAHFDVAMTSHWIDFCRLNHFGDCVPTDLIGISSLRVISCITQSVINAPQGCKYVALSYVWGRSHLPDQDGKSGAPSLHAAPKVIADSIEVTRLLGFQYLWVDRYCINQSDAYEKHDQICRMDAIYASAQLTIIAAAGDDPDLGLPGVNGTLRNPQPTCQVKDYALVSSLTAASALLHKTAWDSRGWTYQEGLLSKRRLLFLSDQVYFECNGMHCAEVVHLPLDAMLDKGTGKTKPEVPSGGAFAEKTVGNCPWWVMSYVSRFTERKLSYQSDVLNAFQGIFRVFEKSRYPLYQLMGVPIMPPYAIAGLSPLVLTKISRSPEDGFMIGLLWRHHEFRPETNFRRSGFPSWTWAGWNGSIEGSLEFSHYSESCDFGVQIGVEMADGSLLPFPREYSPLPQFLSQANDVKYIHVTAKVSACEILYKPNFQGWAKPNFKPPYIALIRGRTRSICRQFVPGDSINGRLNGYSNSNKLLPGGKLTAIIFAPTTEYENLDWQVSVLVVEERGDCAERVGICLNAAIPDVRSVRTRERLIPNFPTSHDVFFHGPPFPTEDQLQNRQDFKEWVDELPTRTIRLG